jgi:hypothetical protein
MAKRKRKGKIPPELEAELDRRYRETTRLLEERIAYHRLMLAEEQAAKKAS